MKIQAYGYFHTNGSIPIVAANWIRVLAKHFDVKVLDYYNEGCKYEHVKPLLGEHEGVAQVGLFFGYPSIMKKCGILVNKNPYKIGVFTTETMLSQLETSYLDQARWNMICVPSSYCAPFFVTSANRKSIRVVHHGIHEAFMQDAVVEKKKPFSFLYVFQNSPTGGSSIRKNLDALLDAYKMVSKEHECSLTIKTSSNLPFDIPSIEEKYGACIMTRHMSLNEMNALYRIHHAYVNPTKAEGFGITPLEAMSCGIPVISPIHSGLSEFLSDDNCVKIKHSEGTVKETFRFATNNGKIFRVEKEDIAAAMIECMENYEKYRLIASSCVNQIRERFSWQTVMSPIVDALKAMG